MHREHAARRRRAWAAIRTSIGLGIFRARDYGRFLSLAIIAFSSAVPVSGSFGAGFDCQMARSDLEHAICNDPQLSSQDDKLNQLYKEIRDSSSDTTELRVSQRAWLARARVCTDDNCRMQAYTSRIAELESIKERLQSQRTSASTVSSATDEAGTAPDTATPAIAENPAPTPIVTPARGMGPLRDETGLLSNDQVVVLENALAQYKARTLGHQFDIVITTSTYGKTPPDYGADLYKSLNLDQPIPGGLLLVLIADKRLIGFRASNALLNGGFDVHNLDNMQAELDKALPDDQAWADSARVVSSLLHVITKLTEIVPRDPVAKPSPNSAPATELAPVAATTDEPFFTPMLIIEISAGCLLLLIASAFYFHTYKFDKNGREENAYWVRFFFLYIFWILTGFFWLLIGIIKIMVSSRSHGSAGTGTGGSAAERRTANPARAPSISYKVQYLMQGSSTWLNGPGGGSNSGFAVEYVTRNRAMYEKSYRAVAIRVVEMIDGKIGSTVWSG